MNFRKRAIITLIVLVASMSTVWSQSKGGFHFGYGSEIEQFALGLNAEFFLAEKFSFSPSFSYYIPKGSVAGVKLDFWELNGDVHLYLAKNEGSSFYALFGVNYVHVHVEVQGYGEDDDGETGANLGLGANFGSKKTQPFFEFKYETVDEGQVVVLVGLRF